MPKNISTVFDWNLLISAITLIVAIASPVLVTIVNNMHNAKIRKLEMKFERQTIYSNRQHSVFQNYLDKISHQLETDYQSEKIEYLRCYHELFLYLPECYWPDIEKLHNYILNRDNKNASQLLNQVTKTLGKVLRESDLQFPKK